MTPERCRKAKAKPSIIIEVFTITNDQSVKHTSSSPLAVTYHLNLHGCSKGALSFSQDCKKSCKQFLFNVTAYKILILLLYSLKIMINLLIICSIISTLKTAPEPHIPVTGTINDCKQHCIHIRWSHTLKSWGTVAPIITD